jgi:uncharacterized membrane protein YphA (DoxX/SURF4 family)
MNVLRQIVFHRVFGVLVRLALGGVLVYSGAVKLPHTADFAVQIVGFRLLPAQASQILAVTLPWVELLTGLLLICGVWARAAAGVSAGLFLMFGVAVVTALARGLDIECGCFGTESGAHAGMRTLLIDGACLAASGFVIWRKTVCQPVKSLQNCTR